MLAAKNFLERVLFLALERIRDRDEF